MPRGDTRSWDSIKEEEKIGKAHAFVLASVRLTAEAARLDPSLAELDKAICELLKAKCILRRKLM